MSESSSEESLPSHSSLLSTWTAVQSLGMVSLTSVLTTKLDSSSVDKILETSRSTDRRKVTSTSSILISCQTAKTTQTGHPLPSWSSRVITNQELMASSTSMTLRSLPWTTPGLLKGEFKGEKTYTFEGQYDQANKKVDVVVDVAGTQGMFKINFDLGPAGKFDFEFKS